MKTVYVLGNSDLDFDSLPIKILPKLKKTFPQLNFKVCFPEELSKEKDLWIIDSANGIKKTLLITDLAQIHKTKSLTVHNFDLSHELNLRKKINILSKINIIALPNILSEKEAFKQTVNLLSSSGF